MNDRIDDLRTTVLEFRASVAEELTTTNRRIDDLADEVRTRIATAETAILNTIRDLGRGLDRRARSVEDQLTDVQGQLAGVDERLTNVEELLAGVDGRLTGVDGRLAGMDERISGVEGGMTGIQDLLRQV